jgi:anti-sigma factor RsiW
MADHNEILPRLCAYHDGVLPEAERRRIEEHLQSCAECRALLSDWSALDTALRELDLPALAPGRIADRVMSRIGEIEAGREAAPAKWPESGGPRRIMIASAAAVLILAAGAGLWHLATRSPVPESEVAERQPSQPAPSGGPAQGTREVAPQGDTTGDRSPADQPKFERETTELALHALDEEQRNLLPAPFRSGEAIAAKTRSEDTYAAAPGPIRPEDSGIPQATGGPARPAFDIEIHYRFFDRLDLTYVELNLVPVFNVEFAPVSYALADRLAGQWDAANPEPTLLDPQEAFLVSNLRIERATLLALVVNQAPTSEVRMRLAEVTWRLANLTADQDDVRSAISAQAEAMRQTTGSATELRGRLAYLRGLVR